MSKPPVLPTLGFLAGFDAAARLRSFTRAAEELHLTQSALSRQVKTLEEEIGVPLFERGRRGLALTAAGESFSRTVRGVLAEVARSVAALRAAGGPQRLAISTTVSFASLWLIPRLSRFRRLHPGIEVFVSADNRNVDLARGEADAVVRFAPANSAPPGAARLFGERFFPVASPKLFDRRHPRPRHPSDLARQVLLHFDDPELRVPWLDWPVWLATAGVPDLVPAGNLRFSQYDQVLQAAVDGQGVALGRSPLISAFLEAGKLVTLFGRRYEAPRAYFALAAPHAAARADVQAFIAWLVAEAASAAGGSPATTARPPPRRPHRGGGTTAA